LPSPTAMHQDLGIEVMLALRSSCPPDLLVVTDLSLKSDPRNEPRPDVVVVGLHHLRRSPLPVEDAVLAVEVISPASHFRDLYAKSRVYAKAGIAQYWVIDPTFKDGFVLTQYLRGPTGEYEVAVSTNKVFSTDEPYPVTIDLPALTARWASLLAHGES